MSQYEQLRDDYLAHVLACRECNAVARPHLREGRHHYVATARLCPQARTLLDRIEAMLSKKEGL